VFLTSLIFWKVIKATMGVRVSEEEEIEGLDIGEHGNIAYPDFISTTSGFSRAFDSAVPGSPTYEQAHRPVTVFASEGGKS
jgi:hypothetical protein